MTKSETYYNWLKAVTPNGSQTLSKMPNRYPAVYPKVLERGNGGLVIDIDGNKYVDMISGLGAISVGYSNEFINRRVIEQLEKGTIFSMPTRLEGLVADKLISLIGFTEQWKFFKTGTETTTAAVKAARAYTNRSKVMACGYHGWTDWYAISNNRKAGIPEFNEQLITRAIYNDLNSFHKILDGNYACIILEPLVFDYPEKNFLETLREWCNISGTLLIFDEVVTGGRTQGFVAASKFKVEPDLITLSKGIANGFPLGAVGGKKRYMSVFERTDFFVSGTFGGECVSLAASLATLEILEKAIRDMIITGLRIKEEFNKMFFHMKAVCKGYPTRLTFDFPTTAHKALFMQEMCLNGVLTGYANMVMADYTQKDMNTILNAIRITNSVMADNLAEPEKILKGAMPEAVFQLR